MTTPADIAISVQDVVKTYRLFKKPLHQFADALGLSRFLPASAPPQEFHALQGVSFDVERGARVGLIGRNGAGKTTLLKLMTKNFRPTAGRVDVNGRLVALIEIGAGFHPEFSGLENIRASIAYNGLADDEMQAAIDDVIDFCELGQFLDQPLKTYSMGMKSRLYFACATAIKPDILVIDEVLGAGDAYFGVKSAERMQRLTSSGCTLILVSHAIGQIMQFCEEAIWIEGGKLVKRGPAIEVVKAYDEFIREMDEARLRRTAGGISAVENGWLREHMLHKILNRQAQSKTKAAPLLSTQAELNSLSEISQRSVGERDATLILEKASDQGSDAAEIGLEDRGELETAGGPSRWPGAPGPKISSFELLDEEGPTGQVLTGKKARLRLTIKCDLPGSYRCRYSVIIFSHDLRWVSRFHSPVHSVGFDEPTSYDVELVLDPLLLSNGEYYLSLGIFGDAELDRLETAPRYDIVSLSYRFRVVDRIKTEQAIFHHPCEWEFTGPGAQTVVERVEVGLP